MTEEFYFFWKHRLSQWHMADFVVDGVKYCCAEQYMMSEKARLFGDFKSVEKIMATNSPREHQALGRKVTGFNLEIWERKARDIVFKGNLALFTQNEDQKQLLLSTYPYTLVEASPYDVVWGIGLAADDSRAKNRATWRGKNWLGEVLTAVRAEIQKAERSDS